LFENVEPVQQCLIDLFCNENDDIGFSQHPLKIQFLDIETYSRDSFPDVLDPKDTVNVITVYDSLSKKFTTWGLGSVDKIRLDFGDKCTYIECEDEEDLLDSYIKYCEEDYPDIISGWHSNGFDIPYLINRIEAVLGKNSSKRLSPTNRIDSRDIRNDFGGTTTRYYISGVSLLDYLDVYKHFDSMRNGQRESYKLNNIAQGELGEQKIEYGSQNLSTLADSDWQKFVEYNIQDVNLLVKLDEKLRFLELVRMLSYSGLCPFEHAMGALRVITGNLVVLSRSKGIVLPTFTPDDFQERIPGAYVSEPVRGFAEDIVSFDLNSLYPSAMISLNLSPETKIGKVITRTEDEVIVKHVNGKRFVLNPKKFETFMKSERIAISKADVLFSQKKIGLIPEFLITNYEKRVIIKDESTRLKNSGGDANVIDRLDTKQLVVKILLNSTYGATANRFSPVYDPDLGRSVTLTGQSCIKASNTILRSYFKERGIDSDPILYNDTDSSYVTVRPFLDSLGVTLVEEDGITVTSAAHKEIEKIETDLNVHILQWGADELNSESSRFKFKREVICDKGLLLMKKRYILHKLDDEGRPCNEFKYTGVEVVRSTLPKALKEDVKNILETMIMTQDQHQTNDLIVELYEKYQDMSLQEVAFTMGCSNIEKYLPRCSGFIHAKGMPKQAKAAYYHNMLLEELKIENKYEKLNSGDKVRYYTVKLPNRYGIDVVGFKYELPTEFIELLPPDIEAMFEKQVFSIVERNYEAVGWEAFKPNEQLETNLLELFA